MILAQQIVWATSLTLSKTSILTLYSKIFTVNYFILAAKITAVVIFLWFVHLGRHISSLPMYPLNQLYAILQDAGCCSGIIPHLPASRIQLGSNESVLLFSCYGSPSSIDIWNSRRQRLGIRSRINVTTSRWTLRQLHHTVDVSRCAQYRDRSDCSAASHAVHL